MQSLPDKNSHPKLSTGVLDWVKGSAGGWRRGTPFADLCPERSCIERQSVVADFLEVNAEMPYTTIVEGLEEILYRSEQRTL